MKNFAVCTNQWRAQLAVLTLMIAAVASCDERPGDEADDDDDAAWRAFELESRKDPAVPGRYVVEDDIFIGDEERLRLFYDSTVQKRAWIGTKYGLSPFDTRLSVINTATQLEMTYCISNDPTTGFTPTQHAEMVTEMHKAAVKWERAADVNFVYVPSADGNCVDGTSGVYFAVRPGVVVGGCAEAFFPGEHPNGRVLTVEYPLTVGCANLERMAAHEFGHILGLFHEESRGNCQDLSIGAGELSEYDKPSIMHNGGICSVPGSVNSPSRRDVAAVRALYRQAKDNWRRSSAYQSTDFNADGKKDIYWYKTEPLLLPMSPPADQIMYGALAPTFVTSAHSPDGNLLRPIGGDFDHDGRADLFMFETGSGVPGNGVDTLMLKQAANNNAFTTNTLTSLATMHQPLIGYFLTQNETAPTPDIIFYGPGPNADPQLSSAPGTPAGMAWVTNPAGPDWTVGDATNWYEPIVGAFDNNSTSDIFFYNPDNPSAHLFYPNNGGLGFDGVTPTTMSFPQLTGVENALFFYSNVTARFNSDRQDDIMFYAPSEANVTFLFGGVGGPGTTIATPANPDSNKIYHPFAGDFDGDRNSDVYWFNTASGGSDVVWYMNGTAAGHTAVTVTAGVTDHHERVPIVGDYTGDGVQDILWWLPSTGALSLWAGDALQTFTVNNLTDTVHGFPVGYGSY